MTCSDEEKIDMAYDVYIVGWLNNYFSEKDINYNIVFLMSQQLYPIKVHIGEPYWMVFNTAPTVDWIP